MKKHYTKFYIEYLKSDKWKQKRLKIAKLNNYICQNCNKKTLKDFEIHHLTYKRLGNEDDKDLLFLCSQCHKKIHEIRDKKDLAKSLGFKSYCKSVDKILKSLPLPSVAMLYNKLRKEITYGKTSSSDKT